MELPPEKSNVCAEFFSRFEDCSGSSVKLYEDRVSFMLNHAAVRSKLLDWLNEDDSDSDSSSKPNLRLRDAATPRKATLRHVRIEDKTPEGVVDSADNDRKSRGKKDKNKAQDGCSKYSKDPAKSTVKRASGNELYKAKKLFESLNEYNDAINLAPYPFEEIISPHVDARNGKPESDTDTVGLPPARKQISDLLPLALANRSATYFDLGTDFYQNALEDIDSALTLGYPEQLRCKLLSRKANIYVDRKEWNSLEEVVRAMKLEMCQEEERGCGDSKEMDKKCNVDEKLRSDVEAKIIELAGILDQAKREIQDSKDLKNGVGSVKIQENEDFESASIDVSIEYSSQSTRSVIANRDLTDAVIFQELPFASVLLKRFYGTHCHHCHKIILNGCFFPCRKCTQVVFCTRTCSESAWTSYHYAECQSLHLFHSVGIAHLAIRIVLVAGLDNVLKASSRHDFLNDPSNISIFRKATSHYERVYSLLDHIKNMAVEDVFQYSLTASLLTNWLISKTSFFTGIAEKFHENCTQVAGVLLRHICQLISNAHAITDVVTDESFSASDDTQYEAQFRIATAIYPAASLMNHACEPNITFRFVEGKKLIVTTLGDVKKGDQIFNCYGPYYRRAPVNARQEMLRDQYFFDCKCFQCVQELTSGTSFIDLYTSFKCMNCEGPVLCCQRDEIQGTCKDCGTFHSTTNFVEANAYAKKLDEDAQVLLERGKIEDALKLFRLCYNQRDEILYKYNSELGQMCDLMAKCYAGLGDYKYALTMLKKSLAHVERRYGHNSIEHGREIVKYLQILRKAGQGEGAEYKRLDTLRKTILGVGLKFEFL